MQQEPGAWRTEVAKLPRRAFAVYPPLHHEGLLASGFSRGVGDLAVCDTLSQDVADSQAMTPPATPSAGWTGEREIRDKPALPSDDTPPCSRTMAAMRLTRPAASPLTSAASVTPVVAQDIDSATLPPSLTTLEPSSRQARQGRASYGRMHSPLSLLLPSYFTRDAARDSTRDAQHSSTPRREARTVPTLAAQTLVRAPSAIC
ncbi:hypothetical protein DAEQUDRAFT_769026 [Daedalea quercina L-15889]|uniref:Uncharacterized protein n=1 Tax=Daedalea quercina L-15889 TaxID=1314783 RepID=A0A165M624_9APHY|nr:hypothetical protein DAEQUDRAFT_769026 [Daedalea quercina L-15889]